MSVVFFIESGYLKYTPTRIPQIQCRNRMCLNMQYSNVKKDFKKINQACFFRGLLIQLLMILIPGLVYRLLTALSLRLGSIIARQTC